jgi:hypothetical protein
MTSTVRTIGLGLALIAVAGCDSLQGKWEAFVYPRSDRGRMVHVGTFKTLRECRAAALGALRQHRQGDYECGLNCKIRNGINVCSRTERGSRGSRQ